MLVNLQVETWMGSRQRGAQCMQSDAVWLGVSQIVAHVLKEMCTEHKRQSKYESRHLPLAWRPQVPVYQTRTF
jgi:hypothetical protein